MLSYLAWTGTRLKSTLTRPRNNYDSLKVAKCHLISSPTWEISWMSWTRRTALSMWKKRFAFTCQHVNNVVILEREHFKMKDNYYNKTSSRISSNQHTCWITKKHCMMSETAISIHMCISLSYLEQATLKSDTKSYRKNTFLFLCNIWLFQEKSAVIACDGIFERFPVKCILYVFKLWMKECELSEWEIRASWCDLASSSSLGWDQNFDASSPATYVRIVEVAHWLVLIRLLIFILNGSK